jgi:hypothetical protein
VERIFAGGFFDRTRFEEVDRIGNVYNRLVLWNAKMIHAASGYFGQTIANSRLFQLFFFDAGGTAGAKGDGTTDDTLAIQANLYGRV